jgi:transcriptional regulator of acetoin/glycerol metabolism
MLPFNQTVLSQEQILEDLYYDLNQVEWEIDEAFERDDLDGHSLNQLHHQRRRIQEDIKEILMFKEAA